MRSLGVTIGLAGLLVAAVPSAARDGNAAARPIADPDRRARLKGNLAIFRNLPPEVQDRVRELDRTLHDDEDPATRARLWAVMERYAGWLSRLPKEQREKIEAVPAGPERIAAVRNVLEEQWLNGLPAAYRKQLAGTPADRQPALLDKWRAEDRARRRDRVEAIRRIVEGMFNPKFFDDLQKFVRETLEPKLTDPEKKRLAKIPKTQRLNYCHQVYVFSQRHGLTPPGPFEVWQQIVRTRQMTGPPE
ncbi:MAG TPA: hypothetical protein VL371_12150 [Gemmataceae bacterium]|nr:hypothetical protein [Gemmataceae bacterium]